MIPQLLSATGLVSLPHWYEAGATDFTFTDFGTLLTVQVRGAPWRGGRMDGWIDGRMDGRTDGWTDGRCMHASMLSEREREAIPFLRGAR